jgi:hypothetical protein
VILVDNIQSHEAPGIRYKRWSHMVSTVSLDELHEMADQLGLKRAWFQGGASFAHYDITPTKRALAVKLGAREVDSRVLLFNNFDYAIKRPGKAVPKEYRL